MVGNQIDNLTLDLFFGHNLCFKYPNGSCEPILDIYVLKAFQWYKEPFNLMNFDPAIAFWRFESPLGLQLPKWELIWEYGVSFRRTFLHSWKHEMWLLGSLLARTFASPCVGHEPKARVMTTKHFMHIVKYLPYLISIFSSIVVSPGEPLSTSWWPIDTIFFLLFHI